MLRAFDPGALLSHTYVLGDGLRVCLRLARPGDEPAIRTLAAAHGVEADSLALERLLRFDRRRVVICATTLLDTVEVVAGFGAIELERGAELGPILVDERLNEGLGELIAAALVGRAAAINRARAA